MQVGGSRPSDKGNGGGHPDPKISGGVGGGGGYPKTVISSNFNRS